ncbi:hypothetical protein [Streptomyces sp. NPDC056672]|uniref:hypothetical protein n=1 Tax=Streptomyces sp. NPDC056672 TaxID=3345906 RepID=UPI0036CC44AC
MELALSQLAKVTAAETHHLDRAIVAFSVNPEFGTPAPSTLLRDYVDDIPDSARHLRSAVARPHIRAARATRS